MLLAFFVHCQSALGRVNDAVVKVYTVYDGYSYHHPWQRKGQSTFHGSGCIIDGKRILTNAHVVSDQVFIQVRRGGQAEKFTAEVEFVAHESDLAILRVDDDAFFDGVTPLKIGILPNGRDKVAVYGFPDGGDKLSITEGVVSRIEHMSYTHSGSYLLSCQIDAPINAGNSGGPVIKGETIVGVAFQGMNSDNFENIGYMVPAPVIHHFLKDIEDGRHDGTPALGISMQKLENSDMRRYYQLKDDQSGALVNKVYPDSVVEGKIFSGDVILSIEGEKIANDGTIEFRPGQRTYFGYLVQRKQINDSIELIVLRNGSQKKITVQLTKAIGMERLIPHKEHDKAPQYYIYGGLVFESICLNYLQEFGSGANWYVYVPTELLNLYFNGEPVKDRREVVVLTEVLADKSNIGFHEFADRVISQVNGHSISGIADLIKRLEENQGEFQVIEDIRGFRIILDRKRVERKLPEILQKYLIHSYKSEGL